MHVITGRLRVRSVEGNENRHQDKTRKGILAWRISACEGAERWGGEQNIYRDQETQDPRFIEPISFLENICYSNEVEPIRGGFSSFFLSFEQSIFSGPGALQIHKVKRCFARFQKGGFATTST